MSNVHGEVLNPESENTMTTSSPDSHKKKTITFSKRTSLSTTDGHDYIKTTPLTITNGYQRNGREREREVEDISPCTLDMAWGRGRQTHMVLTTEARTNRRAWAHSGQETVQGLGWAAGARRAWKAGWAMGEMNKDSWKWKDRRVKRILCLLLKGMGRLFHEWWWNSMWTPKKGKNLISVCEQRALCSQSKLFIMHPVLQIRFLPGALYC